MKMIISVCFILAAVTVTAQKKKFSFQQELPKLYIENAFIGDHFKQNKLTGYDNLFLKRLTATANRAGVIHLPLDNMPCLIPDMKGFNMPVAQLYPSGTIPMR
ncbi:MAG: hypothetical protein EOP53_08080 [Sphingobacteriales bacterium]|nr:MAG: hypothetical protein EOP53_08080 [Sphingobacteriales bacterium]